MTAWAAKISAKDSSELAALRLFHGTECAEIGGVTWLRRKSTDEKLDRALAKVPGLERFEWLASGYLKSPHSRIPLGVLPTAEWRALKDVLLPVPPQAALAGAMKQKLPLTLVRSRIEQSPAALLATFDAWREFALKAPEVRLAQLSFATAEDQQCLIIGRPLPALHGVRLVDQSGILIPCGFAWSPAIDAPVLRELFAMAAEDFVILSEDGTHQVIRAEQFVPASRSAVRLTAEAFAT